MAENTSWMDGTAEDFRPPSDLRPDIPHPARIYNYFLGGKDHFPADREAAEKVLAFAPATPSAARANRAFLQRAVRYVAGEGITQFLDIGTGIPTAGNTHEIAQQVDPAVKVVYIDNDPIVLAHARALMAGPGHGATTVLQADLRDPKSILTDPRVREAIDLDRPVALMLVAVLHFVDDEQDPQGIVRTLLDALAPGSFLILSHATGDFDPPEHSVAGKAAYQKAAAQVSPRPHAEVLRLFDGLELLEPGLVALPKWRPEDLESADAWTPGYGAVARKS
ncbi:SAM-dependent methyltransferase [Kitasatospora sp. NBC_00240]|uniref:SAM-dependent methyltransferase n=1 Tax=Kitasatospora sp. NBC_00240 TaxID=2903567 RepID=UPI0022564C12|nr:SAM-dependent methyltransferase [Kitasatospora sp. NBC_00240]MCX5214126.1 SAM-dependent methyltransferase [Kitasatospora sp. NBC_00240]